MSINTESIEFRAETLGIIARTYGENPHNEDVSSHLLDYFEEIIPSGASEKTIKLLMTEMLAINFGGTDATARTAADEIWLAV